eukprot:4711471-Amphidinium_carterae.1
MYSLKWRNHFRAGAWQTARPPRMFAESARPVLRMTNQRGNLLLVSELANESVPNSVPKRGVFHSSVPTGFRLGS